ncbi:hypothetical protein KAR91_30610 [Candidatus Pacearchaeota archaeon]|nr:hypothetical protein [Candidatus Pacearchaeota archaeon]
MLAREDIDQYYGGMATALNIFSMPQGGYRVRPGLEHIDRVLGIDLTKIAGGSITETAPNGGTAANASDQDSGTSLTTTTGISTTNPYVVVHYDLGSAQDIGVLYLQGLALDAGSSTEFELQYSADDAVWVTAGETLSVTTTAKDYTRRVHGSYRYVRLARIGVTDLTTSIVTLTGLDVATEGGVSITQCINFEFNVEQTYKMVVTDKNIAIYQGTIYLIDIYMPELTSARIAELWWTSSADTLLLFHADLPSITLLRDTSTGLNDVWVPGVIPYVKLPTHDFGAVTVTGTMTPSAIIGVGITITASASVFTSDMIGWTVHFKDGSARITAFNSATEVIADVENEFDYEEDDVGDPIIIATDDWKILEIVWSSTRGYPRLAEFYQGRLWTDGGRSLPSFIYGSVVNDPYNFKFGEFRNDAAIGPLSAGFNDVVAIYPGRNLMAFSTKEEFVIPQSFGDAITPDNVILKSQTSTGSEPNLRPQEVEGGVLYVQRGGSSIQEFLFSDTEQAFKNNHLSLLSSHLVKNPTGYALRKATSTEEGAYLLMTRADGTLTVANVLRSQGVTSFVQVTTQGSFKSCRVDVEDMFFVVERVINGETINWLERFNNDHFMDASTRVTTGLPTDTFTGLGHLEAEECRVMVDESVHANETVSGGSITTDYDATASMEVGLNFVPIVTDLPAALQLEGEATLMGRKTNISEITLRLKDTAGVTINGVNISFRGFGPAGGGSPLDAPPTRFTGVKRTFGWSGWTEDAQTTISRLDPGPLTVLALKKRINT